MQIMTILKADSRLYVYVYEYEYAYCKFPM
jgi:hypothetical protein